MSNEGDPSFNELSHSQKGVMAFRSVIMILSFAGTVIGAVVLNYVRDAASQLDQQSRDIAQIKWEIPAMKSAAAADKSQLIAQISSIEERVRETRQSIEADRRDLNDLKILTALLKAKAPNLPPP